MLQNNHNNQEGLMKTLFLDNWKNGSLANKDSKYGKLTTVVLSMELLFALGGLAAFAAEFVS
jgi:hypothetical protein